MNIMFEAHFHNTIVFKTSDMISKLRSLYRRNFIQEKQNYELQHERWRKMKHPQIDWNSTLLLPQIETSLLTSRKDKNVSVSDINLQHMPSYSTLHNQVIMFHLRHAASSLNEYLTRLKNTERALLKKRNKVSSEHKHDPNVYSMLLHFLNNEYSKQRVSCTI